MSKKPWHIARDYYIGVLAGGPMWVLLTLGALDVFGITEWLQ